MSGSEPSEPLQPQAPESRCDPKITAGAYATGLVIIHTRDEFLLDFIAATPPPAHIVGRVIAPPAHLKRALRALLENFAQYEKRHGAISAAPEATRAKMGQINDLYGKLNIPEDLLGGAYSNSMAVLNTAEEFVLDFLTTFPPHAKLNTRIIVSPSHARRIISVVGDNIAQYEERFGRIDDGLRRQSHTQPSI